MGVEACLAHRTHVKRTPNVASHAHQRKVTRCPVCKVNYLKARQTRNYFAEKVLETIRRRCRYELFGCDFAYNESAVLVAHEKVCDLKPEGAADELDPVEDSSDD